MNLQLFLLIIVVITALAFDFTNGFHDTANAMATSIASGALKPKQAVALSAVLNLLGAFLSTAVAGTIAKDLVNGHLVTLQLVFAGLVGGIVWNLLTWLLGIPSSSSHALVGGIVGAMIAAAGAHGVIWTGVVSRVLIPALVSVVLAGVVGAVGTWLVYRINRGVPEERSETAFRRGQVFSASLVSLAHGTNDAQKTMGVIFLALISYGAVSRTASPAAVLGDLCLRVRDGTGHLHRRLADYPHHGQGTRRDPFAARHGRRIVFGGHHSAVGSVRVRAVHHSGGDRIRARQRGRQTRRRGALGGCRPDGDRLADHAARGRPGRCHHLLGGPRDRWLRRLDRRLRLCWWRRPR